MDSVIPSETNPFGYPETIWRLFQETPRAGGFPPDTEGVVTGEAGSHASRAVLRLQLRFDEKGRVADARFRAYGCPSTIAVGAWIAGWCLGKTAFTLSGLQSADLRQTLEISYDRAHCAMVGEDALRAALDRYSGEQKT
ncbi:MAG: iron-sulfur cluster assembly scaffold protein [Nevskia sp.]|nr:iron-sulfur cluster assembly scaffold protein [Nevskia sp.]